MRSENLRSVDGILVQFFKKLIEADETVSRITFPFIKRFLEHKGVEVYRVSTLGEQRTLMRRLKPLIENAVEVRVAEGDFSEGLFSEREWPPDTRIKIVQVPEGVAPEEVRRFWLGTEMDAYKLSPLDGELDLESGKPLFVQRQTEDIYAVKLEEALRSLGENSPQAAEWFRNNVSPNIDALTFGDNEVEVLM